MNTLYNFLFCVKVDAKEIIINDIDDSKTQGDEKIVGLLIDYGADIIWDKENKIIKVNSKNKNNSTSTKKFYNVLNVKGDKKVISMAEYPDAICALCVIACFVNGKTIFTDIDICRKKETDRIKVMTQILQNLGADICDNGDTLEINGNSPFNSDMSINTNFKMHGGHVDSFLDHRVAMSLACYGLFLEKDSIIIKDAECCDVSFPGFFDTMNNCLNANFKKI